jgi:hypothetical protein
MRVPHVVPVLALRPGGPAVETLQAVRALEGRGIEDPIFTSRSRRGSQLAYAHPGRTSGPPPRPDGSDARVVPTSWSYRLADSPALGRALQREAASIVEDGVHGRLVQPGSAAELRDALQEALGSPEMFAETGARNPTLGSGTRD